MEMGAENYLLLVYIPHESLTSAPDHKAKHDATTDELGRGCIGSRSCGEWSEVHPWRLLPLAKKTPVAFGKEVGATQEPVWTVWRNLKFVALGTRTWKISVVQSTGSRYTDCATAAHYVPYIGEKIKGGLLNRPAVCICSSLNLSVSLFI
jgi:hypothetical protein